MHQNKVMAVRGSNSLFFASGLDNTQLQKGAIDAVGIVQNLASSIASINPFAALVVGAASAFAAIANEGYKMMKDFESAMAEVKTIAGLPDAAFDDLSKKVFNLYKELGTEPPDGLARGLYDIIGSGYEASEALELLEVSAKAAKAGVTSTAVASDGLTTILNSFQLQAEDAARVADVMFAAVDRGKISFEELARQIAQVAPLAAASGFSFEEIAGAIATLTKQGTPGAQAMTQIRSAIEASNEVLGEGASKSLTLQQAFQKMYDTAGGSQNKLKELTGRVEAVNGVLAIAGPNLQGATEDMLAMSDAAGSVDKAFDIITRTTANQWEIFGNRLRAKSEEIGNAVLRMSNGIAEDLNRIIGPTESLSQKYEDQAKKVSALYAEYKDLNTEESRRVEILEEIRAINPSILSGINDQTDAYNRLGDAVRRFNDYALNKTIVDEKFGDDINNLQTVVDRFSKQQRETSAELYNEYAEFLTSLPNLTASYQKELNKIIDSEDDRLEKIRKIRALIIDNNASGQQRQDIPFADLKQYDNLGQTLEGLRKRLIDTKDAADDFARSLSDNEADASFVIQEIQNINSLQELAQKYGDFETSSIKEAVKARREYLNERIKIEGVIQEINSVTIAQYKENNDVLKQYLQSDNEEIVKAAKARQRALNSNYTPTGTGAGDTSKDAFVEMLKAQEEKYKAYQAVVNQIGKEIADKEFESLLKQGADYGEFLKNKLAQTKSFAEQQKIALAAENAGIDLNREMIVSANTLQPITVPVDFEIDTTSVDAINRQLNNLYEEFESVKTEEERRGIAERIKAKEKELRLAKQSLNEEEDLYKNLNRSIRDLRNDELRSYIKLWKDKLKVAKEGSAEAIEAEGNIQDAQEAIGDNFQRTADTISQSFGQLSSLFQKFGDEDTAKLLDQLAGVAAGAGQLAKGIASGNPADIIGGGLQVLNSALSVEVESDTAKFEAAIKELNKAIDKLDYVISQSIGNDRVGSRLSQIEELADLERQANLAAEAEKEAEKQVKLLGITIGKKGKGSGTDQAKLEELAEQAEEARRKVQELREELQQIYTGTNAQSITDSIIEGFRNGKLAAEDFAEDFGALMQDALLQAFQIKYLEKEVAKFYDEFAKAGEDGKYTSSEIEALRNFYSSLINGAQSDLDAINAILEDSGIGALGSDASQKQGLSGAITAITEDTANILAGYLNAMRLDVRQGLIVNQQAVTYLAQIEINTRYNRYLESIDGRFASIESAILQFQAGG